MSVTLIKRQLFLPIFLTFNLSFLTAVHAAFEDTTTGARAASLGEAYVAMRGDPSTLFYNPGALSRLDYKEVASEYSRLYAGLSDQANLSQFYLGYAHPIGCHHTVAVGVRQFSLDSLYTERVLSIGYSYLIGTRLSVGGAFKNLYHSVSDPGIVVDASGNVLSNTGGAEFFTQNKTSKNNFSGDIGLTYRINTRWTTGLAIRDINEPDAAFSSTDNDNIVRKTDLGLSYENTEKNFTLAAQAQVHEGIPGKQDFFWTTAGEKWLQIADETWFALRASMQNGTRRFHRLGFGFGFKWHQWLLDYAFVSNVSGVTISGSAETHRLALGYRFGQSRICEEKLMDIQYMEPKQETLLPPLPEKAPEPPAPAPQPVVEAPKPVVKQEIHISLNSLLIFKTARFDLSQRAHPKLNEIIAVLKKYPKNKVLIEGHTDSRGKLKANMILSQKRAKQISDYIIRKGNFNASRFRVVGHGPNKPLENNNTIEGRAMNRRVDISVLDEVYEKEVK